MSFEAWPTERRTQYGIEALRIVQLYFKYVENILVALICILSEIYI